MISHIHNPFFFFFFISEIKKKKQKQKTNKQTEESRQGTKTKERPKVFKKKNWWSEYSIISY